MASKEAILLELGINFPAENFKKAYEKSFKDLEKAAQRASKHGQGKIGDLIDKMWDSFGKGAKTIKIAEQALSQYHIQQERTSKGIEEYNKLVSEEVKKLQAKQNELMAAENAYKSYAKILETASGAAKDEAASEAAAAKKKLDLVKKEEAALAKNKTVMESKQERLRELFVQTRDAIESTTEDIENMRFEFSGVKLIEAATEAGKELAEPFSALLNKDIEGAGRAFGKLAGRGIGTGVGLIGKGVGGLGNKLADKASSRWKEGKGGLGTSAMGGMGQLLKDLGPMIQNIAKIGPMLGMAVGAVMGLVKMFIDADAMVKEFNKSMVEAGGTGQIFSKTIGSSSTKVLAMTSVLDEFRNAAHDIKNNLDWGISASTHTAVLQNLQAEGVQLTTMQKQYGELNAKSAAFSKDQGSITQAAVAYSRQMGVSLQEVTSFQAEMMTEMGSTLGGTVEQFRRLSGGAEESGIATNKFFAMIRGVSADLSLYNTRLEDAVKLLGKLGKVMSPRNAQKFMQTAMNAYKGMSFQDKVKSSYLAGPEKTAKIVAEDIALKNESIARTIAEAGGGTFEDIKEALKAGPAGKDAVRRAIEQAEAKQGKPLGDVREAVSRLNLEKRRAAGGFVGNAAALSQVSAVGAMEHKYAAATRFGKQGEGLSGEVSGAVGGMDEEELVQAQIMKDAIDEQREKLIKEGKDRAKVEAMTWTQIYDTMDQIQKDAVDGKDAQEEANKRMGTNVQSFTEKMNELAAWFMNTFYNVILGIWGTIQDLAGRIGAGDSDKRKLDKLALAATKSGNKDMARMLAESESMSDFQEKLFASQAGKDQEKVLLEAARSIKEDERKINELRQKAFDSQDPKEKENYEGQIQKLKAKMEGTQGSYNAVLGALEKGMDPDKKAAGKQLRMAAEAAGLGGKGAFLEAAMASGEGLENSLKNLSGEDQGKILEKLRLAIGPEKLAEAMVALGNTPSFKSMEQLAVEGTTPGSIYTHDIHLEKILQEETNGVLGDIYDALRQKGIRLEKPWMDNHMKKMVEEATLDALRVGLLEYFMYKDLSPQDVVSALERGVDPKALGKGLVDRAREGVLPDTAIKTLGNAEGGLVTSIRGGLAQVSPAPGEGLASIGRGERIVPAGGGGGSTVRVELALKDDLGRLIEAKAQEVLVRHGVAEKYR